MTKDIPVVLNRLRRDLAAEEAALLVAAREAGGQWATDEATLASLRTVEQFMLTRATPSHLDTFTTLDVDHEELFTDAEVRLMETSDRQSRVVASAFIEGAKQVFVRILDAWGDQSSGAAP